VEEEEYGGESDFVLEEGSSIRRPRAPKQIFPSFSSEMKERRRKNMAGESSVEETRSG
jgi:hypothetical protein